MPHVTAILAATTFLSPVAPAGNFPLPDAAPARATVPAAIAPADDVHGSATTGNGAANAILDAFGKLITVKDGGLRPKAGPNDPVYYDFKHYPACPGNTPTHHTSDLVCAEAVQKCQGRPGEGFMSTVVGLRAGNQWTVISNECDPEALIARFTGKELVTVTDLVQVLDTFPFATPTGSLEPAGNTTLVTLPVYYQMTWGSGVKPSETHSVSLRGHTLELKARLVSLDYDFGDGAHSGATQSMGGPYPSGDIRHTYDKPGRYVPAVTATWSADYRMDGGAWQSAPNSTTVRGTFAPLTVETATTRLTAD